MNLLAACEAFVHVCDAGSFTVAAARIGIPQSAASRRVAALEQHLGHIVIDRDNHRPSRFGATLLPYARRLTQLAGRIEEIAGQSHLQAITLAVPEGCPAQKVARLIRDAQKGSIDLEVVYAGWELGHKDMSDPEPRTALVPSPPDLSAWAIPLGVGQAHPEETGPFFLDCLRSRRRVDAPTTRLWILPEDDVSHIRDRLYHLRDSNGLKPGQVERATSAQAAALAAFRDDDLVLCTPGEAQRFELHWRPLGEVRLNRTYAITGVDSTEVATLKDKLWARIADVLGAQAIEY
ncbi:LysR family transcriptional regulator [Arthrobacter sp. MA-N2]|uniref:LysR family transcriptional regulator n=1 Tax=Arthrobacter sp. MA-N2 TaxID=1101188 RepID=UPI0004B9CE34|nr:LysR family transcriptional regulator [Arthrobacter sp. MA-N2]